MAITDKDIFAAAEDMQAAGQRPTQTNIREKLGGGSFATIGPALKRWRDERSEESELAEVELPPELAEAISTLGGRVWQSAISVAESRLNSERDALAAVREELDAEVREAQEAVGALEDEALELTTQIHTLEDRAAELTEEASRRENELLQARGEVAKVEAVYQERVSGLEARLNDALQTIERITKPQE